MKEKLLILALTWGSLKSGSWYSYNDTRLGQGRDAAKKMIKIIPN